MKYTAHHQDADVEDIGKSTYANSSSGHLPVLDVREVPCGGPGAVEPVAAGPEVTGEETEDIAPATETG